MASFLVIASSDLGGAGPTPAQLAVGSVQQLIAPAYIRVRLKIRPDGTGGTVSVRPWYWKDGDWWPLRADGATPEDGAAPVTADVNKRGGRAEGYFGALGLSNPVALVSESGLASDVLTAYAEPCEVLP